MKVTLHEPHVLIYLMDISQPPSDIIAAHSQPFLIHKRDLVHDRDMEKDQYKNQLSSVELDR